MRYSCTALVLATALISRVAAGPVKHAHAHFHDKKDAALKVEADVEKKDLSDVDWADVNYDVNWATVSYTYSAGQTWGDPTSAASNDAPASTAAAAAPAGTTAAAAAPASSPSTEGTTLATEVLSASDVTKLVQLGVNGVGINAMSEGGGVWIGTDGPYTIEFINGASEDIILIIWGPDASWVNVQQPLITHSLPQSTSCTISFATGQSGAIAAIYSDTTLCNGQVCNTWTEYTFESIGVVDVSMEVNMNGHPVEVVGPSCTTNMSTCVFQCPAGETSCEYGYELLNCAPGSQPGAQYGVYDGSPSGGCGWLGATTAALTATFT